MFRLKVGDERGNHPEVTDGCSTRTELAAEPDERLRYRRDQREARPRISVSNMSIATVLCPPTGTMMSA